jgi:RNA polymerase sigma-70 factor (ECF subfamily)
LHTAEQALVARFVRHGDEEAFRLLFRQHSPRMYAMALRLMAGRAADAEDVVQDAWLRAATRLGAFEWRSALSTWLTSIVINCARERLRAKPVVAAEDVALPPPAVAPAASAERIDLDRAIASLPDGYREVLVLHDVHGLTHEEIARALDVAPGTSKSQLFHARRAVRARLSAS